MALPSAKHEVKQHRNFVRFRQLPRQGPVLNNNYTRPSALAETRGCYQLARLFVQVCGEAWRRGKVDHVLLCECDHRAGELIGFKVDVTGELIADF